MAIDTARLHNQTLAALTEFAGQQGFWPRLVFDRGFATARTTMTTSAIARALPSSIPSSGTYDGPITMPTQTAGPICPNWCLGLCGAEAGANDETRPPLRHPFMMGSPRLHLMTQVPRSIF